MIGTPVSTNSFVSPKQDPRSPPDWYPYYAGFPERFVEAVLEGPLAGSRLVLDPWNGSGTTTATCRRYGISSVGVDVNPVLTVIAKARLTPISTSDSLVPIGKHIGRIARRACPDVRPDDLLTKWVRNDGVQRIRALQSAIDQVLSSACAHKTPENLAQVADNLPVLASFFYTVLFATVRDLLSRFRPSNPTWVLYPTSQHHRIVPSWTALQDVFEKRVAYFRDRLRVNQEFDDGSFPTVVTGCAGAQPFESGIFDGALTSPPYATRIDYVKGVLFELAILGASDRTISVLRRNTTGTPVVRGSNNGNQVLRSDYGHSVLRAIRTHSSKGSVSYYWPWMSNYFSGLQAGLLETARCVQPRSPICVVVQDSHYKEVPVNLQQFVTETLASEGREVEERQDFTVGPLRSRMNPRARFHLSKRNNQESLLVFR